MRQKMQWWVLGSAALMLIGAFGPWVTALGISVAGTDGSNDGWLVVVAAAAGGGLAYLMRRSKGAGVWPLIGGIAGAAVTGYDRAHVQHAIDRGGAFVQALDHVGWGLNLALIASISMALAGLVAFVQGRPALDAVPSPSLEPTEALDSMYRECSHCKERMRRDAGTCPHCRNSSTPWRFYNGRWWMRESADKPWQWLDETTGTWSVFETSTSAPQPTLQSSK